MTEFDIRELLSDYEEDSVEIREKQIVSPEIIKEVVMNRIEKPVQRRIRRWTGAAAAAVICVVALAATALAVGLLRLDERRGDVIDPGQLQPMDALKVAVSNADPLSGDVTVVSPADPSEDIVYTNVNAVGVTGSPEYLAAQEWNAWCLEHIEDNVLFPRGIENYTMAELEAITDAIDSDVYVRMGANTDEAREMLDAIAAKYGLRLPESFREVHQKDLYDMTGDLDILPLDGSSRAGLWYEGGSLSVSNTAELPNGKTVNYDLYRSVNGVFSKPLQVTTEQDITEEWQYTTADGTTVTLDLGANRSVLMAELPNSFVYVNIRGGTRNDDLTRDFTSPNTLTRADLEAFADRIDFKTLDSIQ